MISAGYIRNGITFEMDGKVMPFLISPAEIIVNILLNVVSQWDVESYCIDAPIHSTLSCPIFQEETGNFLEFSVSDPQAETTISSLGLAVRISMPSSRYTQVSSMRTPNLPGR